MSEKIKLNVIEINKNENINDISKDITSIVNKLIVNEFTNRVD